MALPIFDGFPGILGDPLSANWTVDVGSIIINASAQAVGNTTNHNFARWTGDTFPNDQYVECNCYMSVNQASGPTARHAATGGGEGYNLTLYDDGSGARAYLQRFASGGASFTAIATGPLGTSGQVNRMELTGTSIEAKINGTSMGVFTDATYASGTVGLDFYQPSFADNFAAGGMKSATLGGTSAGGLTEADVVAGGKTITITLSGDTWIGA